jgi:HlyD family secretion protein
MNRYGTIGLLVMASLLIGCEDQALQALGQLESDRIELVAEVFEPILNIAVREGDELDAGTMILYQDTSRVEIRIVEAQANIVRIEAVLAEQISGPRLETIAAVKASLNEAEIDHVFRGRDLERLLGLRQQNLTSIESVDTAKKYVELAMARIEIVKAQLQELEAGTRQEQIQQTNGMLQQARAQLASLEFDKQRHAIAAPVAAIVDYLPFEIGESPRQGDVVAVLLSGEQPYARLYIPESVRVQLRPGSSLQVHVDGLDGPLTGTIRRISSEASFTPYFALTERDRGRLSYVAEVALPAMQNRLPDGVPVQVNFE